MNVVFSRRDAEWFSPPHAPERRYLIAPLTFRERQAFRADLARDGGIYPPQAQMLEALRLAITEAAPGNAEELAAAIARAEAEPDDPEAQAPLAMIEAACAAIPSYAGLLAARQRYIGMLPWVAVRQRLSRWAICSALVRWASAWAWPAGPSRAVCAARRIPCRGP